MKTIFWVQRLMFLVVLAAGILCTAGSVVARAEEMRFSADGVVYDNATNNVNAEGKVKLSYGETKIDAGHAVFNIDTKIVIATGAVTIVEGKNTIVAEKTVYDMSLSSGVIYGLKITVPPWMISAETTEKPDVKTLNTKNTLFTTCDAEKPHYYLKTDKLSLVYDDKMMAAGTVLYIRNIPVFYLPFYYRSLKGKHINVELYPGYGGVEGAYLRTRIGYPLIDHTYTKLLVDMYANKGNGIGGEMSYDIPNIFNGGMKGSVYGYYIDERDTLLKRGNVLFKHWQELTRGLVFTTDASYFSDEGFNDTYVRDSWLRVNRNIGSNLSLTYNSAWYTLRMFYDEQRYWDVLKKTYEVSTLSSPGLSFSTQPRNVFNLPLRYTTAMNFSNAYSNTAGCYINSVSPVVEFNHNMRLFKKFTLYENFGVRYNWQDKVSSTVQTPVSLGYDYGGVSLRSSLGRYVTLDTGINYEHQVSSIITRSVVPLSSMIRFGYIGDVLINTQYDVLSSSWSVLNASWRFNFMRGLDVTLQNSYDLYTGRVGFIQADFLVGRRFGSNFNLGMSYVFSPAVELPVIPVDTANLWAALKLNLWDQWFLRLVLRQGMTNFPTSPVLNIYPPAEQEIGITRDLHCWIVRLYYRQRALVNEFWFSIDLKAHMSNTGARYDTSSELEWYPYR
ncbi:MAG: hypothetical protein WC955_10325 [Elusimicrobiota bacterium]